MDHDLTRPRLVSTPRVVAPHDVARHMAPRPEPDFSTTPGSLIRQIFGNAPYKRPPTYNYRRPPLVIRPTTLYTFRY